MLPAHSFEYNIVVEAINFLKLAMHDAKFIDGQIISEFFQRNMDKVAVTPCLTADLKVIYVYILLIIDGNFVSNVQINLIANDLLWSWLFGMTGCWLWLVSNTDPK